MRHVHSRYLDDGRGFNHGQPATLLEIERESDFDDLLAYIVDSDFYGREYLARQGGQVDDRITAHFWWVALAVARLRPRRVLEIGCGRGDVLRLLNEAHGVEVAGIDVARAATGFVWPSVRPFLHPGDAAEVLGSWGAGPYDVACGFDVWEHLHPRVLDRTIELLVDRSTSDALFVFVVPAFGHDEVFGEPFPLEFEENRGAFERREPFRFLVTDKADKKVPAAGHLTWAHTEWWVGTFRAHGLVRETRLEREVHRVIDPHVPHSVRAFYVLRRDTTDARRRARRLRIRAPGLLAARALVDRWRYQRRTGARFDVRLLTELERYSEAHPGVLGWAAGSARRRIARRG